MKEKKTERFISLIVAGILGVAIIVYLVTAFCFGQAHGHAQRLVVRSERWVVDRPASDHVPDSSAASSLP